MPIATIRLIQMMPITEAILRTAYPVCFPLSIQEPGQDRQLKRTACSREGRGDLCAAPAGHPSMKSRKPLHRREALFACLRGAERSEERRVGKWGVRMGSSRGSPDHLKKQLISKELSLGNF